MTEVEKLDNGTELRPANALCAMEADIEAGGLRWWQLPMSALLWQLKLSDYVPPAAVTRVHYLAVESALRRGAVARQWFLWLSFDSWSSEEERYWRRKRIEWKGRWTPFCRVTWRYW